MKWIGYFDLSLFWLAVLFVVTFSMHYSHNVVFEDKGMLMENISKYGNGTASGAVPCCGCSEQSNREAGVRMVLTTNGIAENELNDFCVSRVHELYCVTETNILFIVY